MNPNLFNLNNSELERNSSFTVHQRLKVSVKLIDKAGASVWTEIRDDLVRVIEPVVFMNNNLAATVIAGTKR